MKSQLAILAMGVMAVNAVFLAPAQAQTEGNFYCGKGYDPIGKTNVPATVFSTPYRAKPINMILWKSDYFGDNFTPQQRCAIVSPKFQAANKAGNLEFLKIGKDGNQPIVCGVRTENQRCTKAGMLFTLKPFGNPQSELNALMKGDASSGIYQSSEKGTVNIREFLNSAD